MVRIELIEAHDLNFHFYAEFQKAAFQDLLLNSKATDSHMNPEFYKWKYCTPVGNGKIARVMDGDKILSSSAMIPFNVHFGMSILKGWHCLDVATLPQERRKGYFLATLKTLKSSIGENEVFFAFPNSGSIPSFKKLGCVENTILTTWINPFIFKKDKNFNEIREKKCFGPEHDAFIKNLGLIETHLDHSSSYLNWRYANHPIHQYTIFVFENEGEYLGYAVVRKARALGRNIVLIMELWGLNNTIKINFLRFLTDWTSAQKEKILILMSTDTTFFQAFKASFLPIPSFLLPKKQVLVIHTAGQKADAVKLKQWKIQTGDWDVF